LTIGTMCPHCHCDPHTMSLEQLKRSSFLVAETILFGPAYGSFMYSVRSKEFIDREYGFHVELQDFTRTGYEQESFDKILSIEGLEHVREQELVPLCGRLFNALNILSAIPEAINRLPISKNMGTAISTGSVEFFQAVAPTMYKISGPTNTSPSTMLSAPSPMATGTPSIRTVNILPKRINVIKPAFILNYTSLEPVGLCPTYL